MSDESLEEYFSPERVMDPRNLGALQPTRMSASRSFLNKMIDERWEITRDVLELDSDGVGHARYTIVTPSGSLTFVAWLSKPHGRNRTGRIIGTSWDMIGSLIDGIASDDDVETTRTEIPKLYEGRAPAGTLIWMRSNQSLRIFADVRATLAAGHQPDGAELKRVGYLMRNTGLDGNGTFGSMPFAAIPAGHPLATSYHAQMLSAYMMRELAVDVVEELARLDAPQTAVPLSPELRRIIGVGNGSALGLVMFVYNRPRLIDAYVGAYVEALLHTLRLPLQRDDERWDRLEALLARTIRYRTLDETTYRAFTGSDELAADLRRVRSALRAARRGDLGQGSGEAPLEAAHRAVRDLVSPEAINTLHTLVLEIDAEHTDAVAARRLRFDEALEFDPAMPASELLAMIEERYAWALSMPLNDAPDRDRVWYQSRAAEEPRSGPREEVPGAHEVIPDVPGGVRELRLALTEAAPADTVGLVLLRRPELEHITRLVVGLREHPYALPHADPHDIDFVPVWLVRLMNSFVHGLDRTEDFLHRSVLGLIFDGAPFRTELASADPQGWWWSYRPAPKGAGAPDAGQPPVLLDAAVESSAPGTDVGVSEGALTPLDSRIRAPKEHPDSLGLRFREARLASGRAMQALNVPEGSWHGARDFFVTAVAASPLAVRGFAGVLERALDDAGESAPWCAPSLVPAADGEPALDSAGQSLFAVGHALALGLAALAAQGTPSVRLTNVVVDGAAPALELTLARYGVDAVVEAAEGGARVRFGAHGSEDARRRYRDARDSFMLRGAEVPAQDWWDVYFPGNAGLYEDTLLSRQHTGTVKDVYVPGQRLTRLFDPAQLEGLSDPEADTDIVPAAAH